MTEEDLHDYNKWLMEVWNPNQLYIPFSQDAPSAYLRYKSEKTCSCNNGIIKCPGCNGEKESGFGICAGCGGSGERICGKCGGK